MIGKFAYAIIDLTISSKVLFLFSTPPFYYGILKLFKSSLCVVHNSYDIVVTTLDSTWLSIYMTVNSASP